MFTSPTCLCGWYTVESGEELDCRYEDPEMEMLYQFCIALQQMASSSGLKLPVFIVPAFWGSAVQA